MLKLLKVSIAVLISMVCFQPALFAAQPVNYQAVLNRADQLFKHGNQGKEASYIPALASVNPHYFAIVLVTAKGKIYHVGNYRVPFAMESISKVFNMALAMKQTSPVTLVNKIGVNPTGMPFNSVISIETQPQHAQNPLVNAGAIATVSLLKGKDSDAIWTSMIHNMNAFSGSPLSVNQVVYHSEMRANQHNRAIAQLLNSYGRLYSQVYPSVMLYTKGCSVNASTQQLAVMAATLANHGVNPLTHVRVISTKDTSKILAMMTEEGLYNNSGEWLYDAGVPAKSGVGGGLIAVVPGKFALALFSPPLDQYGNSVKDQKAAVYILNKLHANLFM